MEAADTIVADEKNVDSFPRPARYKKDWQRRSDLMGEWARRRVRGIYVGYRTLSNGVTTMGGYEEGSYYTIEDPFECWLIVQGPRLNPVRVFPKDVTIVKVPRYE